MAIKKSVAEELKQGEQEQIHMVIGAAFELNVTGFQAREPNHSAMLNCVTLTLHLSYTSQFLRRLLASAGFP